MQREITLAGHRSGFQLITERVTGSLPELERYECGMLQVFIKHTSASLTINENIAEEVLDDFRSWFDETVADDRPYWTHTEEGTDDMPAHIKASLLGPSVTVPIGRGRLVLGRYQGIYLCEHRRRPQPRTLVLTIWGELRPVSATIPVQGRPAEAA
jgi:secondary thiamine-phosphate synthase enzyme